MVTTLVIEMFPNASNFILALFTIVVLIILMQWLPIDFATSHSDLGILSDDQLKFHDHIIHVTTKANHALSMITKSFEYFDSFMIAKLFSTLV